MVPCVSDVLIFLMDGDCLRVAQLILAVGPWDTSGTCPEGHFRFPAATVEKTWNRLAVSQIVGIHRKTASHIAHREPLRNDTPGYELPPWQTVENYWTIFIV